MQTACPPQALARWIAILILISLVFCGFGEMYVSGRLTAAGDAGATARNIVAHQQLFRLDFAAYVVEGLCDATLTGLLYLLLRPAGRELALVALLLRIVSTAAFGAAESFYYAALPILGGAGYLPKSPGALLALGGLSFVTGMLAIIVAPERSSPFFLLPMIFCMLALHLLMRGVDARAWSEKAGQPGAA
jgi:hypothetical protein